jgi:hypothetical protein
MYKPIIRKLFVTKGIVASLQKSLSKNRLVRIDIKYLNAAVVIFREGSALPLQATGLPQSSDIPDARQVYHSMHGSARQCYGRLRFPMGTCDIWTPANPLTDQYEIFHNSYYVGEVT